MGLLGPSLSPPKTSLEGGPDPFRFLSEFLLPNLLVFVIILFFSGTGL
jgi:hypothetical protein